MSLAPQVGLELTALRLTGNRMMVRSTIPTKSSRPLSPVALPAPAPSVNLVTPELLTAPADALHHHDEQDLPLSHPPIQHTRQPSMRSPSTAGLERRRNRVWTGSCATWSGVAAGAGSGG